MKACARFEFKFLFFCIVTIKVRNLFNEELTNRNEKKDGGEKFLHGILHSVGSTAHKNSRFISKMKPFKIIIQIIRYNVLLF